MILNIFPNDIETERIKTLKKYEKLYENDQQSVLLLHELIKKQYKNAAEIVYIAHAIPAKISDFYGDFVQGEADELIITNSAEDQTELDTINKIVADNRIAERMDEWATDQSEFGYVVLLGRLDDNDPKKFLIDHIRPEQYFPQKDGSVIFASYVKDPLDTTQKRVYLYTQQYVYTPGAGVTITREAWTTNPFGRATSKVALSVLGMTPEPLDVEVIEKATRLPIVQINNGRKTRFKFGKSDYADILPQLSEVNERRTHIATALLKNLDAKMQLPNVTGLVNADGSVNPFEALVLSDKDMPEAKYIVNDNPLLTEAREHILDQLKTISWITDVPMWAVTKGSMPEQVESLRIQLFPTMRRTSKKRAKMTEGIRDIMAIGFQLLGLELKSSIVVKYSDVLPSDPLKDAQTEQIKTQGGMSSRYSAIRRLEGYTDEGAVAEQKLIDAENIKAGAVDPSQAPFIEPDPSV